MIIFSFCVDKFEPETFSQALSNSEHYLFKLVKKIMYTSPSSVFAYIILNYVTIGYWLIYSY